MSTEAPKGTSLSEVFTSLYNYATPAGKAIHSHDEAMRLFHTYCPEKKCDYVRDTYLGSDFSNFPKINTSNYQRVYGNSSVQKVFNNSVQFPDKRERSKCDYFTGTELGPEFVEQINYCNAFTKIASDLKIRSNQCSVIFQKELNFPIEDSFHTEEVTASMPIEKINGSFLSNYPKRFPLEFCFKRFFWTKCHSIEKMPLEDFNELLKMRNKKI